MPSSRWSTEVPTPIRQETPLWMKVALGLAAVPFILGILVYARLQDIKARTWPVILQVSRRLQTDDEARRLFQANPELARGYATEDVFLERVRAYRDQFARLPDLPPKEPDRYESFPTPTGFSASIRGAGQDWVYLEVRSGFLMKQAKGEGLMRLEFTAAKRPNAFERRALRKAKAESDWRRYQEICAQLTTDEGTRALWQQEPGLSAKFHDEAHLLRFAADVRVHLRAYPEPAAWSKVRLHRQVQSGPSGPSVRLQYPFPSGTLMAAWSDGKLTDLQFEPPK